MNGPPIFLILNHLTDEYARYADYLDDATARLWLITTNAEGMPGFRPQDYYRVDVVPALTWPAVQAVLATDRAATAAVQQVVAVSEYDLELGAVVREQLGVKGYSVEYVRRFRDKAYSKALVAAGGVRVPDWLAVDAATSAESLEERWQYPIVVKPVSGAASAGVTVCHSRPELAAKLRRLAPGQQWEAETFIGGALYHCDGYVEDGAVRFLSPSRYLGSCTAFNEGRPLGAVSVQHTAEAPILADGAARSVRALGLENGVFHLEAFIDRGEFVFLEIGHRPGGGEILPLVHRHAGVDLMSAAVRLSCELPALPAGQSPRTPAGSYGWLMCSAVGRQGRLVRGITARGELPPGVRIAHAAFPGQRVPADPEYDFTGMSAHIYAGTAAEAEATIQRLIEVVEIRYD
ncbi:MAG TPA: ATP-grasp domain-containing protein [Jatrophihabitans sp.]|nr:ATP-grasp domain-containing protein [Jatrophihabitans sp.]